MKKFIATLVTAVMAMSLFASLGFASTQVWANFETNGDTWYYEKTLAGGVNWQEHGDVLGGGWYIEDPSPKLDLVIIEKVDNIGQLSFSKYLNAPTAPDGSNWDLQELKRIQGSGDTLIDKYVSWTTNTRSIDNATGLLAHPTVMQIDVQFHTANFHDYESLYSVKNIPPAQTDWDTFYKVYDTNDDFNFVQGVGKNMDILKDIPTPPVPRGEWIDP